MAMRDLPPKERKLWYAAGLFASLLTAIALNFFSKDSAGDWEGRTGAMFPSPPGGLKAPASPALGRGRGSLGEAQAEARAKSELDELLDLFAQADEQPAARKFAKEFLQEPKLRQVYEDFKREQESGQGKTTLRSFGRRLGEMTEFRRLAARFASEPGFRDLAAGFLRHPELRGAVREQLVALRAVLKSRSRQAFAAQSARRGGSGARAASFRAGGARTEVEPGTAGGGQSGASQPFAVGSGGADGRGGGAGGDPSGAGGAPGGHEVPQGLSSLDDAGQGKDAAAAFVSLCYRGDPAITKAQCQEIEQYLGDYDLWDSCVKADLYEKCRSLCRSKPELNCGSVPDFYALCEVLGEADCEGRCRRIPGCTPPPPPPPPVAASPPADQPGNGTGDCVFDPKQESLAAWEGRCGPKPPACVRRPCRSGIYPVQDGNECARMWTDAILGGCPVPTPPPHNKVSKTYILGPGPSRKCELRCQ